MAGRGKRKSIFKARATFSVRPHARWFSKDGGGGDLESFPPSHFTVVPFFPQGKGQTLGDGVLSRVDHDFTYLYV